ncbi:MAG: sulfatase [Proteobacteria bacterium]|nr:sulfatase [Pseudomonadota bacterium]
MTTSNPAQPTRPNIVRTAAVLGLICGALDVALAILRRASSFDDLQLIFPATMATAGLVASVFLALWWTGGHWATRRWQLAPSALVFAVASALATTFIAARIGEFSLRELSADALFLLGLYAGGGVAAGVGGYFASIAMAPGSRAMALCAALLSALPVMLFAMLLFLWSQLYRIEVFSSPAGLLSCAAFAAAVAAVLFLVVWPGAVQRGWRASVTVAVIALLAPMVIGLAAQIGRLVGTGDGPPHAVRHIILLTSDTLRADVLGVYGGKVPTPAIDGLAHDGAVFDKANTVAPWTLPSLSTLVTGVSPAVHLVRQEEDRLPSTITTVAERFSAAGYHTAAVVDNAYLRPKANLAQGFDDYLFMNIPDYGRALGPQLMRYLWPALFRAERPCTIEEHTAEVQAWLAAHADRDFFLWVHYFDPHAPYEPRHDYVSGKPPDGMAYEFVQPPQVMSGLIARSDVDKAWIRALYEGEVRGMDDNIGLILEQLRALDLYDGALIAFTSDHGEEFWDHGAQGHGHSLYDELLHVPLIIKLPDGHGARRVSERVSTERLAPTLLEAADVAFDAREMSGSSLLPLMRGEAPSDAGEPVYSETQLAIDRQQAVTRDEQKFVHSLVTSRAQLYDLRHDPGETESRLATGAELATAARKLLEKHEADALRMRDALGIASGESAEFDSATMNRLRGLGYIK